MIKNRTIGILCSVGLASLLSASELSFSSQDLKSDSQIMSEVIIKNSSNIKSLESRIAELESKIITFKTEHNNTDPKNKMLSTNNMAKIVNVEEFAHYREKPSGKILKYLKAGTFINIKECSIFWCYSEDFDGGFIAKSLLEFQTSTEHQKN